MGAYKALMMFDSVRHVEEIYTFNMNSLLQCFIVYGDGRSGSIVKPEECGSNASGFRYTYGGPRGLSDHCPIIVEDKKLTDGLRPFRSLDSWFTHESFLKIVKEEWRSLGDKQFTDKLKALTAPLRRWHKDNFGEMDKKIAKFEEEIKRIDDLVSNGVYDGTMEARRKALVTCCERWYVRKEVHWKQMSRSRHVRDMDKNTRYFHNIASARRRNNRIDTLVINGRRVKNLARIKIAIRDFYKELYHQERSPILGFRDGLVEKIDEQDAVS
ncbi:uncharacterized protein LOC107464137 [Arachis duranensis]|uniref:Uncharacterized protein LOC107464137 n=1 Tax=Arachis duranensis TaxID=130453 RepID=A0A6P4BJ25_ARADU|nr:uncharacterized protein LOC107464137 [Arachis duranensis]XP_025616478.1 uncharacterized protein LOC112708755 [Arachis hypogaea]